MHRHCRPIGRPNSDENQYFHPEAPLSSQKLKLLCVLRKSLTTPRQIVLTPPKIAVFWGGSELFFKIDYEKSVWKKSFKSQVTMCIPAHSVKTFLNMTSYTRDKFFFQTQTFPKMTIWRCFNNAIILSLSIYELELSVLLEFCHFYKF